MFERVYVRAIIAMATVLCGILFDPSFTNPWVLKMTEVKSDLSSMVLDLQEGELLHIQIAGSTA